MKLSIRITGDREVMAKMQRLGASLYHFGPTMIKIGERLVKFYQNEPFISEGSIYGKPWPALSLAYEQYKVKHFPGRFILQRSYAMQNSFHASATDTSVAVGNTARYFQKHQRGIGVPQRLIMALTRGNVTMITGMIRADIKQKIANS